MSINVAIVGATGAVGQQLLTLLEKRSFPLGEVRLFASPNSKGKTLQVGSRQIPCQVVDESSFEGIDISFFAAGSAQSRQYIPWALKAGSWVIDKSSENRMRSDVPLVVPEVNGHLLSAEQRLVANPNCTATLLVMCLRPLLQLAPLDRVIVSTYQSASGAGQAGMEELLQQTKEYLEGRPLSQSVFPHPYAFNLFSHNTKINEYGYNDEEWKVIQETQKILGLPQLKMNVTCVRVPILRAHSESVTVEFKDKAPDLAAIRKAYEGFPGVRLQDDRGNNHFPMPNLASGEYDVFVGRIRQDISHPQAINFFLSGDQLLKGAALNALQIAETIVAKGLVARKSK